MTTGLGYDRYVAHGSDLGAGVTAWLARNQPHAVAGIHLATPGLAVTPRPRSANEEDFAAAVNIWTAAEGSYMHEHATKPATLGAPSDSPAGLADCIAEKIVAWSSSRPDGTPAVDRDLLLATLTLYWAADTITSSLLPYWAHNRVFGARTPAGDPSPLPTAVTIFGGECVPFPKPRANSPSAITTSRRGPSTPSADPFPPSPNPTYSPASCATRSGQCATKPDPRTSRSRPRPWRDCPSVAKAIAG